MYYSTVFSIRQHKIADLATQEKGEPPRKLFTLPHTSAAAWGRPPYNPS